MLKKKDYDLLFLLSRNFRISKNRISKELNISSESLKNKISSLENFGIIKGYKIGVSYSNLGFREFDLYLRIRNYSKSDFDKIINFFTNSRYVSWVGNSFGKFDFRASLIVRDSKLIYDFIENFKSEFSFIIEEYLVLEVLKKYKVDSRKVFENLLDSSFENIVDKKEVIGSVKSSNQFHSLSLDEKKLLKVLDSNPNQSIVELSNHFNLTPEAISYKLKSLEKRGLITQYSIVVDGNKFNKIWAVFLFRLNLKNKENFRKFILSQKNVSAFVEVLGSWDFSVSVFASSVQEIQETLMGFRNKFPEELIDYEMIILFKTFKYPKIPQIVFGEDK